MDTSTKPTLFEARIYQPLILSFEKLTDLRMKRGVRYKHKPLIILLFLSKLGGADSSAEVADWVQFRFAQLKSLLKLDWHRSPHEVTWKRFLEKAIKAEEVEEVFSEFLRSLSEEAKELLNLDGKLVRGTKAPETDRQLHLLALQASDLNLTVEQIALTEAENEISGARRLLEKADKGAENR